jgi:hypothetical protein
VLLLAMMVALVSPTATQENVAGLAEDTAPAALEAPAPENDSRLLVVPYPIVDPAIGNGLLLGPVWMRDAPRVGSKPGKPQAYGAGAIWTDGGTRGGVAFDHRAWQGGVWRSTAVAAKVEVHFAYSGVLPDQDVGFVIDATGAALSLERTLGEGPHGVNASLFAADTDVSFDQLPPLPGEPDVGSASLTGIRFGWTRDTRDNVFLPSTGSAASASITVFPEALGASFDAQSLGLKWTGYRPIGKAVMGLRAKAEQSFGNPPFYLRPYIAFRGVAALRYAGETVTSLEGEYRRPINRHFDVLVFGGAGHASADFRGIERDESVSAFGAGVRFKPAKLFGLTFGLDYAYGPDGGYGYVQIGNAWTN